MFENETKFRKIMPTELAKLLDEADIVKAKARRLDEEGTTIRYNVQNEVKHRFSKFETEPTMQVLQDQMREMDTQWSILAASMVKVKRSISVPGFHTGMRLCVNSKYGFKEPRRYTKWSPFGYLFRDNLVFMNDYYLNADKVFYMNGSYLSFGNLQVIPQLDQEKVKKLFLLTKDSLDLMKSWQKFFNDRDPEMLKTYHFMKTFSNMYSDEKRETYATHLPNLDKIIDWKEQLIKDTTIHKDKWDNVINKWKAENKNYMILTQLSKKNLKV